VTSSSAFQIGTQVSSPRIRHAGPARGATRSIACELDGAKPSPSMSPSEFRAPTYGNDPDTPEKKPRWPNQGRQGEQRGFGVRFVIFSSPRWMRAARHATNEIDIDLRKALAGGEVRALFPAPLMNLPRQRHEISSCEARFCAGITRFAASFCRMLFIPFAEEMNADRAPRRLVFPATACKGAAAWPHDVEGRRECLPGSFKEKALGLIQSPPRLAAPL